MCNLPFKLSSVLAVAPPGEGVVVGELDVDAFSLLPLLREPVPSLTAPLARGREREPGLERVDGVGVTVPDEVDGVGSTPIVVSTLLCL